MIPKTRAGGGSVATEHADGLSTRTLLFTDIVDSSRRWEESPDMGTLVDRHFAVLTDAVESSGGEIFAYLGDGLAAAFDGAASAVAAAVDAQRQLGALALPVRMGIHTGEVQRIAGDYRGRSVNRAARIMALARGGDVLLSDVTASLVRSAMGDSTIALVDAGSHHLRGLDGAEHLWQVVHPDLADRPGRPVNAAVHSGLPTARSPLVGRTRDAAGVVSVVAPQRVVTLTGVGGVGKTRLAIRVAQDMRGDVDDVRFVSLVATTDPDDVSECVALAVVGGGSTGPAIDALRARLSGHDSLLVLDNCEHVVESVSVLVDALITSCPGLRILVTSREPLGLEGEQVVRVRPLDVDSDAIDLFAQRVRAAGSDIADAHHDAVRALCARLDGLPLAIELAAAHAATLGVAGVLEALDAKAMPDTGRRDPDVRHRTMRATIDWSYRLLDDAERRLFRALGVFVGGFELDAALHIASGLGLEPARAVGCVDSLVRKSMVSTEQWSEGGRSRMLETVRAFALEQLELHDERAAADLAMATWMATIAGAAADDPGSAVAERSSLRLEREADNWRASVRTAIDVGSSDLAAALCGPPAAFFLLGRHDLGDAVRPLLDVCTEPLHRQAVLSALLVTASGDTDPIQFQRWADEVTAVETDRPTGVSGLMRWLAAARGGDFARAVEICLEESRDERLPHATRDLFIGIAVLDQFSLTDGAEAHGDLLTVALDVAARADMALTRVSCLLGVAWAIADDDPARAVRLVRAALDDVVAVPPLTRLTLPGSAARLLSRLEPRIAAAALLDQLAERTPAHTYADLIPLFYGASLLDHLGRGDAPTMATVAARQPPGSGSMMDVVEQARRASSLADPAALEVLDTTVREALEEIAGGHDVAESRRLAPVARDSGEG